MKWLNIFILGLKSFLLGTAIWFFLMVLLIAFFDSFFPSLNFSGVYYFILYPVGIYLGFKITKKYPWAWGSLEKVSTNQSTEPVKMMDHIKSGLLLFLGICFFIYVLLDDNDGEKTLYKMPGKKGIIAEKFSQGFSSVVEKAKYRVNYEAAEQGDAQAQFNLGQMYQEGKNVTRNLVIAYMWYDIAISNGNRSAINSKSFLQDSMTPEQLAEAQKLARECIKKNYKDCG